MTLADAAVGDVHLPRQVVIKTVVSMGRCTIVVRVAWLAAA
jgi:hypothetical protein